MQIGLFPLGIVLFPGAFYPLYIFESRYKTLVGEAQEAGSEFGINLVEDGRMFQIGCMARVDRIENRYEDGSMDIVVEGTTRFHVTEYHSGVRPFLTAEAEPMIDLNPVPEYPLLERTIGLFNQLVESVYGSEVEAMEPSEWVAGGAAFKIAEKSGLELHVRQQLLESRSETERLEFLCAHLEALLPRIKELEKLQMLIRNDGYLR